MEKTHEITHKEIRGITTRTISWLFGLILPIAISGGVAYANIMNALKDTQTKNAVTNVTLDIMKADIKALQIHQTDQDIRLTRIEEQVKDKIFMTEAPPNYKFSSR
jgi:hypothetical protein